MHESPLKTALASWAPSINIIIIIIIIIIIEKVPIMEMWTLVEVRLFEFFWQFLSLFCNIHWLSPGTRTRFNFFLTMATLFLCHSPASLDPTAKSLNLKCG